MIVEQMYTKSLAAATYYIESDGEAALIDPLREPGVYLNRAKKSGATIKYIFETHFHADFVSGHLDLSRKCGAKIVFGPTAKTTYHMHEGVDGEYFTLGTIKIKLLHTPGHTPESSSFLLLDENGGPRSIFTGDTLFIGDVGRPDLAVKSNVTKEDRAGTLYDSIHAKILPLDNNVIVYPAHGAGSACGKKMSKETFSTLGEQKKSNYALQDIKRDDFIKQVIKGILPPPLYFPKIAELNRSGYKGIDEVTTKGTRPLSVDEIEKEHEAGAFLLDTRAPQTFNKEFIPGSINLGLGGAFEMWAAVIISHIESKIIIISDDDRVEPTVARLAAVGFQNVIGYLKGGFEAWRDAGKKIESIESISAEELALRMESSSINLLDIRKPPEFETGHVDSAKNFPLDYIYKDLDKLKPGETYYIHCQGGYRSMAACSVLKSLGYEDAIDIDGGFASMARTGKFEIKID